MICLTNRLIIIIQYNALNMIHYFKICIRCIGKCFCKNDFVLNNQDTWQNIMSMYQCEETKMQIE